MRQEIRLAFRLFWRARAPSAIALLSIALTVGAASVVFAAMRSPAGFPHVTRHESNPTLREESRTLQRAASSLTRRTREVVWLRSGIGWPRDVSSETRHGTLQRALHHE